MVNKHKNAVVIKWQHVHTMFFKTPGAENTNTVVRIFP